ncbi:MAG: hypothetical protein GY839_06825 [candidate division Zixibacteria bacterium]|nr:hypothetical protein [candidate division Zixibacteria bacterium]
MIERYLVELWNILQELGFPLLLGITIAALLHVILPPGFVHRNFGGRGLGSIFKASLIGVPMPLCSCGVIPTAIGLKQDGASDGASTGFLISTPQTGVDSILVSASFLGWPFAIFKLIVAFITGIIGGSIVDIFDGNHQVKKETISNSKEFVGFKAKLKEAIDFGVYELLGMIYFWIIIGVLAAALITTLVPPGYLSDIGWITGIGGMFLMLAISLPLYVCATASVPIAASLIAAGMPAGTAIVFLMAGPASNIATVGALYRAFGGRVLAIYLATVAVFSIIFGWLFGFVIGPGQSALAHQHHDKNWFELTCTAILLSLMAYLIIYNLKNKFSGKSKIKIKDSMLKLKVQGMTCQHCAANVTKALENVPGVTSVKVSIDDAAAFIDGSVDTEKLIESVKNAGYEASA